MRCLKTLSVIVWMILVLTLTDVSQIVYCIRWTPEFLMKEFFRFFLQYDVTQFHWCKCVLSLTLFFQIIINQQNAANIKHGYQYQCHHINILPFTGLLLSSELHTNDAITMKTTLARYMLPPSDPGESQCWYLYDVNHQHECFIMLWLLCVLY